METQEQKEERKGMYLARVSNRASRFDNYDEIMKEAEEKWEKENL